MSKITIKHYLNKSLKAYEAPSDLPQKKLYRVYLQITYNRKTTKIPSGQFCELMSEQSFKTPTIKRLLKTEADTLRTAIEFVLRVSSNQNLV